MKEYNYPLKSSHNINTTDKELESQLYCKTIKKKKKKIKQTRMMMMNRDNGGSNDKKEIFWNNCTVS